MTQIIALLSLVAGFLITLPAARQIGIFLSRLKMPLISGFLLTGIVAGPHVLGLIPVGAPERLRIVDEIALAFIAFAAGGELFLRQLRNRLRSIQYTTAGLVVVTFSLGSTAFFLLSPFIPMIRDMPIVHRSAVALLAGAILVARSPSSAIAVVNELRAKGPFTRTVLGVTVFMDAVVITIFSICAALAGTVLAGEHFDLRFVLILLAELLSALVLAWLLAGALQFILARRLIRRMKTILVLAAGYAVFLLSTVVRHYTHHRLGVEILLEPLLICMLAGFLTVNTSRYRTELMKVLHDVAPFIYVAFFTLTGAALELDVLALTWPLALALFAVRIVAIYIGASGGSTLAGEPPRRSRIAWMGYVTQAGVGLGLAKEVAVEFPAWGSTFATVMISVIVLNQIAGPPLFKWALHLAGEARPKGAGQGDDSIHDAVIFGLESDSLALARLLQTNGWQVRIATRQAQAIERLGDDAELEICAIPNLNLAAMKRLGVDQADAVVAMLDDEDNYLICQWARNHFGIGNVIVRLNQRALLRRFHETGALVVEPSTAIINLLDQFVRSPSTASLLLGMEKGRDIIEFELRNADLDGTPIRDLNLPLDLHIISVRRQDQLVVCGGFTRLRIGDWLSVVGSRPSLEQMMLQFGEDREYALVHLVERATSRRIASRTLENEVHEIIHEDHDGRAERFRQLIADSTVLDLPAPLSANDFFHIAARTLSEKISIPEQTLYDSLVARERESSTALRPDLAIPHIIIDGQRAFTILLARCKAGIHFSELAPRVQAVFVLVGTLDERDYHLYALSAIAKIVQGAHFTERWLGAKNEAALRRIARAAD
ncbi:MAG: PTS transporter subunit EIIA [Desulfatitalea sp.]|nr:cation:proton antiporter [Desulfatitalea sp.]NNJ99716.1 PTS transporter subunit EIIA [Desulfatitalea sp.]